MSNAIFRTNTLRCENAASFVRQFYPLGGPTTADSHLYCLIGQEDNPVGINPQTGVQWVAGSGIWPNDSVPPLPSDDPLQDQITWSLAIGGQLVNPQSIALCAPNRQTTNWTASTTYDVYNKGNPNLYSLNFYVYNTSNEVFACMANPNGVASVTMPNWYSVYSNPATRPNLGFDTTYFNDGTQSIVTTPEGIVWKYLYTMTTYEVSNLLQQYWLPVNYGNNLWPTNTDPRFTQSQDSIGPYGNAYRILGAHYVMIDVTLQSGAVGSGLLPSGIKYRQISLVQNPYVNGSTTRATFNVGIQPNSVIPGGGSNQFQINSGLIYYIENDSPIFTQVDQSQEVQLVVAF